MHFLFFCSYHDENSFGFRINVANIIRLYFMLIYLRKKRKNNMKLGKNFFSDCWTSFSNEILFNLISCQDRMRRVVRHNMLLMKAWEITYCTCNEMGTLSIWNFSAFTTSNGKLIMIILTFKRLEGFVSKLWYSSSDI